MTVDGRPRRFLALQEQSSTIADQHLPMIPGVATPVPAALKVRYAVVDESSTPFHLIVRFQQADKRPDARRASATTQMAACRLARREPSKYANAVLQSLARE